MLSYGYLKSFDFKPLMLVMVWCGIFILLFSSAHGQVFGSGSDGSDGALILTIPGSYDFDPLDSVTFGRVLDPDGDGVFHFTSITIGPGVTLRLTARTFNRPVYWLAQDGVVINGALDLNGEPTTSFNIQVNTDPIRRRMLPFPGSGGYTGGAGGISTPSIVNAQPGEGPGGGNAEVFGKVPGQPFALAGEGGKFSGNPFLIPLIGGSGGGGSRITPDHSSGRFFWHSGSAGGGAILIASSLSIDIGGSITANGGPVQNGTYAGGGAGGGIRLVAPVISGTGQLIATGGNSPLTSTNFPKGSDGVIRMEAFEQAFVGTENPKAFRGFPAPQSTLFPVSSVRVLTVDGIPMPLNPSGSFSAPDVTLTEGEIPVVVELEANGIPPGTVITLRAFPDTPVDPLTVFLKTQTTPLVGTLNSSTATATFSFPRGFSRCVFLASWP